MAFLKLPRLLNPNLVMRSGFSTIKNGEKLGYPFREAFRSLAPLVDEMVIAIGECEDNTREILVEEAKSWPCPLVLIDSPWTLSEGTGGWELSLQSNVALEACKFDTCLYIQCDEVIHEEDYPLIQSDLNRMESDSDVSALAFNWLHFYGDFQTIAHSRAWYRREVRAIKKSSGLRSYGDAQGFRVPESDDWKNGWRKAPVALSKARVFHYGWVRPPEKMAEKSQALDRLWHGNTRDGKYSAENVYPTFFGLRPFQKSHPVVMQERIEAFQKSIAKETPFFKKNVKKNLHYWRLWGDNVVEKLTGYRLGEFCNYSSFKRY